jgi:hypothetical protein
MYVLVLEAELHLPTCRSLKAKRAVIRPIIDTIRHRHHVSVAEVDHQDRWQRATIALAVVAGDPTVAEERVDDLERLIWSAPDVEVIALTRHWLPADS